MVFVSINTSASLHKNNSIFSSFFLNDSCIIFFCYLLCGHRQDTSVVPPLIYAVMGTSREIAIGPVAVVSLLLSSMVSKIVDPAVDPVTYRALVFTVTFLAGVFQVSFGLFRYNDEHQPLCIPLQLLYLFRLPTIVFATPQVGFPGGFPVARGDRWVHGRSGDRDRAAAAEGIAWAEPFHQQHRRRLRHQGCLLCTPRPGEPPDSSRTESFTTVKPNKNKDK